MTNSPDTCPAGADAELIELGRELESRIPEQRALDSNGAWDSFEALFEANAETVARIEALPAHTLEGLKVKARAVLWCHLGEEKDFSLVLDQDTTDMRLATQVIAALARGEIHEPMT